MARQTVDYGIDLGTTSSSIAKMESRGAKIIKCRLGADTVPSAVAVNSQGQVLVGKDALDKYKLKPALQFKRLMGSASPVTMSDESSWSAVKLSSELLKDLKASARRRYDEEVNHVVITVPAMFQQPQCAATNEAAEAAGLCAVTLLQEPIAAATAYLNDNPQDGYYLVYDLGGGTFDTSIVRLKDNEMSIVAHGGDNYLGGSDFDRLIYDWTLSQLKRSLGHAPVLDKVGQEFLLMQECERAKIRLSDVDPSHIDLSDLELGCSNVEIDRSILEDLIEDEISKSISLAKERLRSSSIPPSDVKSVLLVGGPTQMPYIRKRLAEELGIPLNLDQDPMTVVALGAAIHAGGLLIPERGKVKGSKLRNEVTLELFYEPVAQDRECTLSGKVVSPVDFAGEVQIKRSEGDWETGWVMLKNGAFVTELLLANSTVTHFDLTLRDLKGTPITANPANIAIRFGLAAAKPVTPYKYGIALDDGSMYAIVPENEALPAYGRRECNINKDIVAGSDEGGHIYFLEGNSSIARYNVKVGELYINGKQLKRTLHANQPVEIRMRMDESRLLKAQVFIPSQDIDFEVVCISILDAPPIEDLEESALEIKEMIERVEDHVGEEEQDIVIQAARELEQIEADLTELEEGKPGQAERVQHKIATVKESVSVLDIRYGFDALYAETISEIDDAENIANQYEDAMGVATTKDLRQSAEKYKRLKDEDGLKSVKQRAKDIFWEHYHKTPECYLNWVEFLRDNQSKASDAVTYHECVRRAERCIAEKDLEGAWINCREALRLLPPTEQRANRFYDTIIKK